MVNIRTSSGPAQAERDQDQSLAQIIGRGRLVPVISGEAIDDLVLSGHCRIVSAYADGIGYPMTDRAELTKLAKYQSLHKGWKDRQLKQDYLDAVGSYLYESERTRHGGQETELMQETLAEASRLTVSQFAGRLGCYQLDDRAANPLLILADLPLPIYLTASPYDFLEVALRRAGKAPRTDLCRWHPGLDNVPSVFSAIWPDPKEQPCAHNEPGREYTPCEHKPLVYHLYGLDAYADSLLLTEDDYLDFLVAVAQGRGKDRGVDPVHDVVKGALQSSALLLLGFSLSTWAFRTLYRGLIKPMPEAKLYERYCCLQLVPNEQEKLYLESYLRQEARFDKVFWQDVGPFCYSELHP